MRVLGAIESAPGPTTVARIRHVSEQAFLSPKVRSRWGSLLVSQTRALLVSAEAAVLEFHGVLARQRHRHEVYVTGRHLP
jgi:hypothetical protein